MASKAGYVRFKPPYASLSPEMVQLMVSKGIGRNAWAVIIALSSGIRSDRTLDLKSAQRIAESTGLSEKQIARGMAELKAKNILAPVIRQSKDGTRRVDRSCFGHVATYCFTKEAWEFIEKGFSESIREVD